MKKIEISIPEPCHEQWNDMAPVQNGRFCNSCAKTVVDFTSMSDQELVRYFQNISSSVCGRFQEHQLNRTLSTPKSKPPFIKYFFQLSFPALLMTLKASAQKLQNKRAHEKHAQVRRSLLKKTQTGTTAIIQGDVMEKPVENVGEKHPLLIGDSLLNKSSVPVKAEEIVTDRPVVNSEEIVAFAGGVVVCRKPAFVQPVKTIKTLIDTAFKRFAIYPNPVLSGSSCILKSLRLEKGVYHVGVTNNAGQYIKITEINIAEKTQNFQIALPYLTSGSYLVQLVSKQSGKSYTEKILVK